jgi:hypothetical protein
MTDCSRVRTLLNFEGKVGERWLATGCFSKEAMSRSDLRGGGGLCSVCVCVCKWPWAVSSGHSVFFFCVLYCWLTGGRVQTDLCRFFVFCLLVEILEEPHLCPVQN